MKALKWVLERLKEKTTWIAIITSISTVFGVEFAPEIKEQIIIAGMAIVTAVLFGLKEKK
jgi:hypothetical protein